MLFYEIIRETFCVNNIFAEGVFVALLSLMREYQFNESHGLQQTALSFMSIKLNLCTSCCYSVFSLPNFGVTVVLTASR